MATVVSFINFKGGVGKTTLSVELAASLYKRFNSRVLMIDLDPSQTAPCIGSMKRIGRGTSTRRERFFPSSKRAWTTSLSTFHQLLPRQPGSLRARGTRSST